MHDLPIITLLAVGLAFALLFGWLTQRLGLSTLVGYMLAGIAVGPYTPGFVGDRAIANEFAEVGVILLMFGVGMHFHPQELLRVRRVAIPGAIAQSVVATGAGWAAARAFGWSDGAGLVFGLALAVASTVVLIRMLTDEGRLSAHDGHVAVGWLIVEDMFTVLALVILPALAVGVKEGGASLPVELALALGKAAVFAALVWFVGTRLVSRLMERMARTRSEELFTVAVFVIALGVAMIAAQVFHLSVALGAFFAGLVVGQSRFGPQVSVYVTPFRDVFAAMFFVSVGMLFNPSFVVAEPLKVVVALAIIVVVKPAIAVAIVLLLRDTRRTAATVGVGLAQIGEFSFILGALGLQLGALPADGLDALIAAALVSIALNPLLFRALRAFESRMSDGDDAPNPADPADAPVPVPVRPVIVTGAGELARRVVVRCASSGIAVCAVSKDIDRQDEQREAGAVTVFGDAGAADVLKAAQAARARVLVVTEADLADKMRVCVAARAANARIVVVATAALPNERAWLREFGVAHVCDTIDDTTDSIVRAIRQAL